MADPAYRSKGVPHAAPWERLFCLKSLPSGASAFNRHLAFTSSENMGIFDKYPYVDLNIPHLVMGLPHSLNAIVDIPAVAALYIHIYNALLQIDANGTSHLSATRHIDIQDKLFSFYFPYLSSINSLCPLSRQKI